MLLASLEPAAQPVLVPRKLHPCSLPHVTRDPGALLLNTLFLPCCSPSFPEQTFSLSSHRSFRACCRRGLVASFIC